LVQFFGFFILKDPIQAAIVAAFLLLPQTIVATFIHNHAHVPIFRGDIANRILNLFLFLETGMLVSGYALYHIWGHHKLYLDPHKDPSRWVRADGSSMSHLEFVIRYFFSYPFKTIRIGKSYPKLRSRVDQDLVIAAIALTALLVWNPINALILFVTPIILVWITFIGISYDDHVGLHGTNHYDASHTKTNPVINFLFFNNGYHLAHHVNPSVHWSELPEFHESIKHKIPELEPHTLVNRIFK